MSVLLQGVHASALGPAVDNRSASLQQAQRVLLGSIAKQGVRLYRGHIWPPRAVLHHGLSVHVRVYVYAQTVEDRGRRGKRKKRDSKYISTN